MMKIGRIFSAIILFANLCFGASAYFQNDTISQGDRAILILSADGKDVKFPQLDKIGDFDVVSTSQSQNIQNINGNVTRSIQKAYTFYPSEDVTLKPLSIIVDGKGQKTEKISLHVSAIDVKNAPYSLSVVVSSVEPYQNEAVALSFIFKMRPNIHPVDLRFSPPHFDGFWVKNGEKEKAKEENGYVIQKINYLLFPQKEGVLQINPASIDIGLQDMQTDMFGMPSFAPRYKRVYSKKLLLHVKPLQGAKYVGDFEIKLDVDKTEIDENGRVNATLKILGNGDLDDIGELNLETSASVFADKPTITTHIEDNKLKGEYTRKFSLSSERDFTIKPLKFTFFNPKVEKVQTVETKEIFIHVKASKQKEKQVFVNSNKEPINAKQPVAKVIIKEKSNYIFLVYGFLLGVAFSLIILAFLKMKKGLHVKGKYDEKTMLKKLLKIDSPKAKEYIKVLEEHLYGSKDTPINKKEIEKFIKSYEG